MKINIKPISVNQCWQGKRFKTPIYKRYEKAMDLLLPKADLSRYNKIELKIIGYMSNKQSDIDNIVKPIQDILQKKWNFNDSKVYRLIVTKKIVAKWNEWIGIEVWEILE